MPRNTQISELAANAVADAVARLLDGGYLRIYTGPQPASADTDLTSQQLLATNRFSNPSAASAAAGVVDFGALESAAAEASGAATWFRCTKADGTTVVMDGSMAADGNIVLSSYDIQTGGNVQITGFSYTAEMTGA